MAKKIRKYNKRKISDYSTYALHIRLGVAKRSKVAIEKLIKEIEKEIKRRH